MVLPTNAKKKKHQSSKKILRKHKNNPRVSTAHNEETGPREFNTHRT